MSWIVGSILTTLVVMTLVPRHLLRESTLGEKRVLRLLVAARVMMALVAEHIGTNSGRFFRAAGWDSGRYHDVGSRVFKQLSEGYASTAHTEVPGTGGVELATGYFYLLIGSPNRMAAVFAWTTLATIGNILFWLATRDKVTDRRGAYAAWVLLAPTLLFWSSTLSKEAIILLGLGCLTMALRLVLTRQIGGRVLLYLMVGLIAIGFIRPFVALMFFASAGLAALLARTNRQLGERAGGRLVLALLVVGGLAVSISLSGSLFRLQPGESVLDAAYEFAELTSVGQGTSAYSAEPVRSPLQVPGALAIVLLRPYIWETQTAFQVIASVESLVVLLAVVGALGGLIRGQRRLKWDILTLTAALHVILFSSAISTYGNFGLVVRQRNQVWQFVIFLAFCTVPAVYARGQGRLRSAGSIR